MSRKKTELTEETARAIARALNVSRFERTGYDPKAMAQRNLAGKTHYADDDTLRFFHARINHCRTSHEGLILAIVESVAEDYHNTARGFRFVAFDLFGNVLNNRSSTDELHRKSDKAAAEMLAWLESFDVLAHYKAEMTERAERLKRESADLIKAARVIRVAKVES